VGERGDNVALLLMSLHDFDLIDVLHLRGGRGKGDGEGKYGDFHG